MCVSWCDCRFKITCIGHRSSQPFKMLFAINCLELCIWFTCLTNNSSCHGGSQACKGWVCFIWQRMSINDNMLVTVFFFFFFQFYAFIFLFFLFFVCFFIIYGQLHYHVNVSQLGLSQAMCYLPSFHVSFNLVVVYIALVFWILFSDMRLQVLTIVVLS